MMVRMTSAQPGRLKDDDEAVLNSTPSPNWTAPFRTPRVGPCGLATHGKPVSDKLVYLQLSSGMQGVKTKNRRVNVLRCKLFPCLFLFVIRPLASEVSAGYRFMQLCRVV